MKKFVCLGGGIGTVNLIKGLKHYSSDITVIVSAADNGGSAGRLRRLFHIFPPGDAISCLAALMPEEDEKFGKLLTYRFPGNRYGSDNKLSGQKLGNLLFVGAKEITGSVEDGLILLEDLFRTSGKVLPATTDALTLSALTVDDLRVEGEQTIDLGKYKGKRILDRVMIHPDDPKVPQTVLSAISKADVLIAGPGDLYTTILPVLLIPAIKKALISSTAKKIYIVNVANKPFETKGYAIDDYIASITKHLGTFPFETVIANNDVSIPIPRKYKYKYVLQGGGGHAPYKLLLADLVDKDFPLYHEPKKLARCVVKTI
ncbi:MAG: YvcK family protein [bacterium]|nr:YvcK family protein [bacterium]